MNTPKGWGDILELVSVRTGVPQKDFFLKTRKKDIVLARRIFYILCSKTICRALNQREFISLLGEDWSDRSILSYYEKCHSNDMKFMKDYRREFKSMKREAQKIYTRVFREQLNS